MLLFSIYYVNLTQKSVMWTFLSIDIVYHTRLPYFPYRYSWLYSYKSDSVLSMIFLWGTKSLLQIVKKSCTLTNCLDVVKVKLATIVEGHPKSPFSIATTPKCRGGRYSFPRLLHFTLDPYLIMLSVKQGGIKYHFLSLLYDSTGDWTQVSRATGEHSNR